MARAADASTAARWASQRAVALWLTDTEPGYLAGAEADGAQILPLEVPAGTFAVLDAMRAAGLDDTRLLGVASAHADQLRAARRAGARAVVGLAGDAAGARALHLAEPDHVVAPDRLGALDAERYSSARPIRPQVLLNPGPALTSDRVKRAAAIDDLCHREPEFGMLDARVRAKLLRVAGDPAGWRVALVSGSGTAADELALTAAVRPGRRAVIVRNGVYGERLWAIAERAGMLASPVQADWTQPIDPGAVQRALSEHPDVDAVALVHHETTTGLLNPVAEVAAVASAAGARTVVDAISSFGAERLELAGSGLDFVTASSNKCLQGLPGAAFVLVSREGAQRASEVPSRSVYLDLAGYLDAAAAGAVLYTPAIPALAALDAALDEILEEGLEPRSRRLAERAAVLDAELGRLGLEQLIEPGRRSLTVRSLLLPDGINYGELHDRLKAAGYVIYAGQGRLASQIFRVCCMGTVEPAALRGFAACLEAALAAERVPG